MKWMVPREKLDRVQEDILGEIAKYEGKVVWIKGHAGSGKSVLLLYALRDFLIRNKEAKVVVVVYTNALVDLMRTGMEAIPELPENVPVINKYLYTKSRHPGQKYDAIFCDEVQDLTLDFINTMAEDTDKLILCGDAAQSIYTHEIKGPKVISPSELKEKFTPLELTSTTIYRLPKSVVEILQNVYSDLRPENVFAGNEDADVRIFNANNQEEEIEFCWEDLKSTNRNRPDEISAILIFKKEQIIKFINNALKIEHKDEWQVQRNTWGDFDFNDLNNHLRRKDMPLIIIGKGKGALLKEADEQNKIAITTYHSAKGLDFDAVCLPFIDSTLVGNEQQLCLVALSRSKRDLLITFSEEEMYAAFKPFLSSEKVRPTEEDEEDDYLL